MANAASYERAIDGDVSHIRTHAAYYAGIAEAIAGSIASLRQITSALVTTSDAVTAFSEIAEEVRGNLAKVEDRYDVVAEQLRLYATALADLQARADGVQIAARDASEDIGPAQWRYHHEQLELNAMAHDDPARVQQARLVDRLEENLTSLHATVNARNHDLDALLEEWRRTADGCADAIKGVIDGSSVNDGFVEWLKALVEDVMPFVEMILDIIAIVLTVVAILLVFTGVGAAIAPALMLIARGAQLLSKVLKIIRIALTVALVVTGKMPLSKLGDLAIELALDKVGGKLGDKLTGRLDKALQSAAAQNLQKTLKSIDFDDSARNLKELRKDGIDDWLDGTFAKATELDDWTIHGVELDDLRVGNLHVELDALSHRIDAGHKLADKLIGFNLPGAGGGAGGDLAWSIVDTGLDVVGVDLNIATNAVGAIQDHQRPTLDDLVGAR